MTKEHVKNVMRGPAPATVIAPRPSEPRQQQINIDRFVDGFAKVETPRGALPIDWRLFSAQKHKDFATFSARLPQVPHDEKVALWNMLIDALQHRSIAKARNFIAACEKVRVQALSTPANRIFWSSPWGKTTATGTLNQATPDKLDQVTGGQNGRFFAEQEAAELKRTAASAPFLSLEGNSLGHLLDGLLWDLDWSVTVMLWGVVSRMFAAGAVGDAILLVTDGITVGTVFWNDELPALRMLQHEGIVNRIYIKYRSSVDLSESPLIDIDAAPDLVPVLGRRDQRDERYNAETREWELTGRTSPVYQNLERPTNLGTIKKAMSLLVEMLPQCQFGPNRPLPRFEAQAGVLCRLEKERRVVRMSELRHGDHFVIRTWKPHGTVTRTILVRPYRQAPGPMRGPNAYRVERRLTELRGMLEAVDNHLTATYFDWNAMPKQIEFDGDTIIADGMVVAQKVPGLAFWKPLARPTRADPFWEQKYTRHALSPRTP